MNWLKPHFIVPKQGSDLPYLRRWFLTPWSRDDHPLKRKRLPNIYLHQILRSDDDRALHDHPWVNMSIILWGGYIEHVFERPPVEGIELPPVVQKRRRFLSVVYRRADQAHRLELYRKEKRHGRLAGYVEKPCWSLFITWRKRRPWGFWGTKEGVIGEHHVPVTRQLEDGKVVEDWITLQHKGPVAHWLHNLIFDTYSKLKG